MTRSTPETYTEVRPWGKFEQFTKNESTTVKIITVHPNQQLSLQLHHSRAEFWRVIAGNGTIEIDRTRLQAHPGDEFFIPMETTHRMNAGTNGLQILEIAYGHFDEADIVRLEDTYGRS